MGFSVTASQVILIVAAFGAGSVFAGALLGAVGDVDAGYREAWRTQESAVHTNLTVPTDNGFPNYAVGPQRFQVEILNAGSTVVEVSALTFLIDGTPANEVVEQYRVEGDGATDLVLPGETLEVWFRPVTASPSFFKVVAGNGAEAYWKV